MSNSFFFFWKVPLEYSDVQMIHRADFFLYMNYVHVYNLYRIGKQSNIMSTCC